MIEPKKTEPIADALVLVLQRGKSTALWHQTGFLAADPALHAALLEQRAYARLVVVGFGPGDTNALTANLRGLMGPIADTALTVICPSEGEDEISYAARVPDCVLALLSDAETVVVKTAQLDDAGVAGSIADSFLERGTHAGLVARGEIHRSRFLALDSGPNSDLCVAAGLFEQRLCQRADAIIGTTKRMVDDLCWRHGVPFDHAFIVPNYVIEGDDPPDQAERTATNLVALGPLTPTKRTHILVEAMAQGPAEQGCTLRILGDGPERQRIEDTIAEHNLAHCVTVEPGHTQNEIHEILQETSIFLLSSSFEGHPRDVLEAMQAGCAVIVSNAAGLRDTVHHGVTGLVIDPNAEAFGLAITQIVDDLDWRMTLAAGAARSVVRACGLTRVLPKEIAAHRAAIQNASRARELVRDPHVFWDPALLRGHPDDAALRWELGVHEFTAKLPALSRTRFIEKLSQHLGGLLELGKDAA